MANFTDFAEDEILDFYILGNAIASWTAPHLALLTVLPTDPTDTITEVSGSSYARQTTAWDAISQSGGVTSIATNAAQTFPVVTSSAYTVKGVAIFGALTSGNAFWWGSVAEITLNVNDQYVVASGNVTITLQ